MKGRASNAMLAAIVGAIELVRAPVATTLLGIVGYIVGGAAVAACAGLACWFYAIDVAGYRRPT